MEQEEKKATEEMEAEANPESVLFQALIGNMIYRMLPEDYWEEEGIGWK